MKAKLIFKLIALSLMSLMVLPLALASCNLPSGGGSTTAPDADPKDPTDNSVTTAEPDEETTAAPSNETTTAQEETTAAVNDYSTHNYKVLSTLDNIKFLGRSSTAANGISVSWPASGMEFNADCQGKIKVRMISTYSSGVNYACYVDGEIVKYIKPTNEARTYTICDNLEKGAHTIKIVKTTQAYSTETFMNITVDGVIEERPADKKLFVEFIGDSITAGFGLDDSSVEGAPVYNTTRSWAYLAAEENGFDYSLVAIGGIGVAASNDTHNGKTMTDLYP